MSSKPVVRHPQVDAVDAPGLAPDITMHALLTGIFDTQGAVAMAHAAAGYLRGIQTAISSRVSPEAAYASLQRHADAAALELSTKGGDRE